MRLLVDESTGKRLATLLAHSGHDVLFVGDIMPSASDDDILTKAETEDRVLISDDKDFGELIIRLHRPAKGVILIRTATTDADKRFKLLEKVLSELEVKGKFIIVKEGRIRIR